MKRITLAVILAATLGAFASCQSAKRAIQTGWEISTVLGQGTSVGLIPPPPGTPASPYNDNAQGWTKWSAFVAEVSRMSPDKVRSIYQQMPPPTSGSNSSDWISWQNALIAAGFLGLGGGAGAGAMKKKMKAANGSANGG